jgi:serine/threonine-protein kinase
MCEVWEARRVADGARIALKRVLPKQSRDPRVLRSFLREAELARRLDHPGIARIDETGTWQGSAFIAMELVDGLDARRALRRCAASGATVPFAVACHLVERTADALRYAHGGVVGGGLVHRDVNPPNVLLSWTGDVKLTDFGIVRACEDRDRTTTGSIKGKEAYLAPETLLGTGETPATDVYALGVMLHEIITGEPPMGDLVAVAARVRGGHLPLDEGLDPSAAAIVVAMMDLEPRARPSAEEVSEWLASLVAEHASDGGRNALVRWLAHVRATGLGSHDDLLDPFGARG